MAIKPFIESLIEFNGLDTVRDERLDNILLSMIVDFDNLEAETILEIINGFLCQKQ